MRQILSTTLLTWPRQGLSKYLKALFVLMCALIFPLLLLCLWWAAFDRHWLPEQILPAPQWVWLTTQELWQSGELQLHFLISTKRIIYSVLLGGSLALGFGSYLALSKVAQQYFLPSLNVLAQFPIIAWVPLLMIFLGIDEALKVVAIALAVFTPILLATIKGIQNTPQSVLEVARVYQLSPMQRLFKVILPSALPSIISGIRQGVMQAWLALVFVELLASSEGIGFLMVWGRQLMQMDIVFMSIILIGLTGFLLDSGLSLIEKQTRFYATRIKE